MNMYICIILRWFLCRKTCANLFKLNGIPRREQELLAKFLTAIGLLHLTLTLQIQIMLLAQTVYRTVNPNLFFFPTLFPNPPVSRNTYSLDFSWIKNSLFPLLKYKLWSEAQPMLLYALKLLVKDAFCKCPGCSCHLGSEVKQFMHDNQ